MYESVRTRSAGEPAGAGEPPALVRVPAVAAALAVAPEEVLARALARGVRVHRVERGGRVVEAVELEALPRLAASLEAERCRALEQEVAEAERRAEDLAGELAASRAVEDGLRGELRAVRADARALGEELARRREDHERSDQQVSDLERQAEALDVAWDEERRARLDLARRVEELQERVAVLEAEVRAGLDREETLRREGRP